MSNMKKKAINSLSLLMFITFPNDPGCQLGSFKAGLTTGKERKLSVAGTRY